MNFRDLVLGHLANYKSRVLNIAEPGIFRFQGEDIEKLHILPIGRERENVLALYRDQYYQSEGKVKLHRYFHHLNSSQALCINLFYPLKAANHLDWFSEYLNLEVGSVQEATFEYESTLETTLRSNREVRKTSFDFHIQGTESEIFAEVKYTEDGFGSATADQEHLDKFNDTYLPLVEGSQYLAQQCKDRTFFLDHYQILRNLVHISECSYVIALFPFANIAVRKEVEFARDLVLTPAGRERFRIVDLEDFVAFLEEKGRGTQLGIYYGEFRAKYLPSG